MSVLRAVPAAMLAVATLVACRNAGRDMDSTAVSLAATGDSSLYHAQALLRAGAYRESDSLLHVVLDSARARGDSFVETEALTWLLLAAGRRADYAAARRYGEESISLKVQYQMQDSLFRSYNGLGLVAWDEGRLDEATRRFGEALREADRLDQPRMRAAAANNLGLVHLDQGEFLDAIAAFTAVRDAGRELDLPRYVGAALTNLGTAHINIGDPETAVPFLQEALAIYRAENDPDEQTVFAQLYEAHMQLGRPGDALAALDSAYRLSRAYEARDEEARNLEALAWYHREMGNLVRARALFDSALVMMSEIGMPVEAGAVRRALADLHLETGNLDQAARLASESLSSHREAGDHFEVLLDLLRLAEVAHHDGRLTDAARWLAEGRDLSADLRIPALQIATALTEADLAERDGDDARVLEVLSGLLREVAIRSPVAQAEIDARLARAQARQGNDEAAITNGRRAIASVEYVRGNITSSRLRTTFLSGRFSPYEDLVEVLVRNNRFEEALQVADAARGRALVDHLAILDTNVSHRPSLTRLRNAQRMLRTAQAIDAQAADRDDADPVERGGGGTLTLYDRLETVRTQRHTLLAEAADEDPATVILGVRPIDVGRLQATLAPGEAVVEYFLGTDRSWIFVVRPDVITATTTPTGLADLASSARVARHLLADPQTPDDLLHGVLGSLHQHLIAPVTDELRDVDYLFVVPHRVLGYLPFAALWNGTARRYLMEDYFISNLPVAAALPMLRSRESGRTDHPAAAVFAPFPDQLVGTEEEAESVKRALPRAAVYEARRATEARFRAALATPGIVHAATHGVFNVRNPSQSAIRFFGSGGDPRDDGELRLYEVLSLDVRSTLVFLAGCETGLGSAWSTRYAQGEDFATLAQAFLFAGAHNVNATLWPIEDRSAAMFARYFYEHLEPEGPVRALAMAQRHLLSMGALASPYYWAAYQTAGSGTLR